MSCGFGEPLEFGCECLEEDIVLVHLPRLAFSDLLIPVAQLLAVWCQFFFRLFNHGFLFSSMAFFVGGLVILMEREPLGEERSLDKG